MKNPFFTVNDEPPFSQLQILSKKPYQWNMHCILWCEGSHRALLNTLRWSCIMVVLMLESWIGLALGLQVDCSRILH